MEGFLDKSYLAAPEQLYLYLHLTVLHVKNISALLQGWEHSHQLECTRKRLQVLPWNVLQPIMRFEREHKMLPLFENDTLIPPRSKGFCTWYTQIE
jgi:hypothetical protein